MKLVYLSGPITAKNEIKQYENIIRATEICAKLRQMGISVICPHTSSMFHGTMLTHEEWIAHDIRQLFVCDKMYLMGNWENSIGCKIEVKYAIEHKNTNRNCNL